MITKEQAEEIVKEELNKMQSPSMPFAVYEPATIETAFGWVFFYDSAKFFETGDDIYHLAGNGPIIVNKITGVVTKGRSNQAVNEFINEYERSLKS
jgi:hypothetical protein